MWGNDSDKVSLHWPVADLQRIAASWTLKRADWVFERRTSIGRPRWMFRSPDTNVIQMNDVSDSGRKEIGEFIEEWITDVLWTRSVDCDDDERCAADSDFWIKILKRRLLRESIVFTCEGKSAFFKMSGKCQEHKNDYIRRLSARNIFMPIKYLFRMSVKQSSSLPA